MHETFNETKKSNTLLTVEGGDEPNILGRTGLADIQWWFSNWTVGVPVPGCGTS